jgi:thiamine-phosphate pyrophosphorylase
MRDALRGIYAIVNEDGAKTLDVTNDVLRGGCRIVQYRAKSGPVTEHILAMRRLTRECGALLFINDDWRSADAFDADGVHIGPDDVLPAEVGRVREALGARLLGVSCGTEAEARAAERDGADYIGAGSVYHTGSKSDAGEPIGIAGLRRIAASTALPVAAIGGITLAVLPEVRATGVAMAAVLSALALARDREAATRDLVCAWNGADGNHPG